MMIKKNKNLLSLILSMMLIVAMAFSTTGCADNKGKEEATTVAETTTKAQAEDNVLGEGSKEFEFTVVDADGNETVYEIHTDKEIVGEALLELELIEGDQGDYGLYVKKVNGITADYDVNGTYWAFYVNNEYASTGVDTTIITEGDSYSFKVEK